MTAHCQVISSNLQIHIQFNIYIQVFLNIQHDINVYIVFYLYTHINDELVPYMYMTKSALSLFFVRKIRDKKCE